MYAFVLQKYESSLEIRNLAILVPFSSFDFYTFSGPTLDQHFSKSPNSKRWCDHVLERTLFLHVLPHVRVHLSKQAVLLYVFKGFSYLIIYTFPGLILDPQC